MSEADSDTGDKPFEPSQKKLDDARGKGEIPRAQDLNTAAGYAAFLIACVAAGPQVVTGAGGVLQAMISRAETMGGLLLGDGGRSVAGPLMGALIAPLAPVVGLPPVAVLVVLIARRGFAPSLTKISPKLSRIAPLSNAKNKFGRAGLFEFAKSLVKLIVYSVVLGIYLWAHTPDILAAIHLEAGVATGQLGRLLIGFLGVVLAVALVIGVIDTLWQQSEHMRQHRMSHKEMTDERKDAEGDPHMKQQRRQRGYEIAMNRMLADVPKADVVIVNPQHYAVALKWDRARGTAPLCVAKGVDEIAARIRESAAEAGVPIHRDPPTARSIYATIEIGQTIDRDHYRAVAAAIRFADRIRRHAR